MDVFTKIIKLLICTAFVVSAGYAAPCAHGENLDDGTMLMFFGENIKTISVATKREESALKAPAVTEVITREDILASGAQTLGEILRTVPGFYISEKEWGKKAYLRGIANSVLYLYDTVPYALDTDRESRLLDRELSLASIKRIEIIRGPGSVLWGPDAYAGIVNIVPLTGKDMKTVETGLSAAGPESTSGAWMNAGHDNEKWNTFLSVSGQTGTLDDRRFNVVQFFGDDNSPVSPEERFGSDSTDRSRFVEMSAGFELENLFTVTARLSDSERCYTVSDAEGDHTWQEKEVMPTQMIKLEGAYDLDDRSAVRFTCYAENIDMEKHVIDTVLETGESSYFTEAIYTRKFFAGAGDVTAGISYRNKDIDDAPVWESYMPDYLTEDNTSFLPSVTFEDYTTELTSFFGQYRHRLGKIDLHCGLRYDSYNLYDNSLSANGGIVWMPGKEWVLKMLVGTAYRTPLVSQLEAADTSEIDPENVESYNLQASWMPQKDVFLTATLFQNKIKDHVLEDIYAGAGLSTPNNQKIYGIELEGGFFPLENLEITSALTLMKNTGPAEQYLYNDYTVINPDGTEEKHYTELTYGYDIGCDTLFSLTGTWEPFKRLSVQGTLQYIAERKLYYVLEDRLETAPGVWLFDINTRVKNFLKPGWELTVFVNNLFDEEYQTPGTYEMIEGDPFTAGVSLSWTW